MALRRDVSHHRCRGSAPRPCLPVPRTSKLSVLRGSVTTEPQNNHWQLELNLEHTPRDKGTKKKSHFGRVSGGALQVVLYFKDTVPVKGGVGRGQRGADNTNIERRLPLPPPPLADSMLVKARTPSVDFFVCCPPHAASRTALHCVCYCQFECPPLPSCALFSVASGWSSTRKMPRTLTTWPYPRVRFRSQTAS